MQKVVAFLKAHWTWVSGLLVVVANYCMPAVSVFLTAELGAHPGFKAALISFLTWLGQVRPRRSQQHRSNKSQRF